MEKNSLSTKLAVSIGELLWDLLPEGKKPGGAPANLIYHAAQNGVQGIAVTAVGDDTLGREIVEILRGTGIGVEAQIVPWETGVTKVSFGDDGLPIYDVVIDRAWDHIQLTTEVIDLVSSADVLCYGTIASRMAKGTRQTLLSVLDLTKPDAIRLFDINLRSGFIDKELFQTLLEKSTILKINDEEIKIIADLFEITGDKLSDLAKHLRKKFDLDYVILTAGDKFSTIIGKNSISTLDTPRVPVADTIGAGDAFAGAFIARILSGDSIPVAHRHAVMISAYVCTTEGAWPHYPVPYSFLESLNQSTPKGSAR